MSLVKRTKPFQIKLTEQEHSLLMRLAAKRALRTGNRISAGDMLRELAFSNVSKAGASDSDKGIEVRVKLLPEVRNALVRSGVDMNQAINNALIKDMEMAEASL